MSFFSKFNQQNLTISTLVCGDQKIELKFRPLGIKNLLIIESFQGIHQAEADVESAMAKLCSILSELVVENELGEKPSKDDFMELDVGTLTAILEDLTNGINAKKKTQPTSTSEEPALK